MLEPLILRDLKHLTFWPPSLLLLATLILSWWDIQQFVTLTEQANGLVIQYLSQGFTVAALLMVLLCVYLYFSPLGNVRIGGPQAEPIYSPFRWFAVSLTTVIAMGLLFWSVAEPVVHFNQPAPFSLAEPRSAEAQAFAISTLFVHWSIAPYAIYTVPALCFALSFYNLGERFSARILLKPLLGRYLQGRLGDLVDALVLFSVVVGMAATLTAGLLLIASGIQSLQLATQSPLLLAGIAVVIIATTLISSTTGIRKGIQILARTNTYLFIAGLVLLMFIGPQQSMLEAGLLGITGYAQDFIGRHLLLDAKTDWPGWWTVAFFASWFAWAPISCLFLGKIARGYSVRAFIWVNLILPALFGMLWFSVFGGAALHYDQATEGALHQSFQAHGLAAVVYRFFAELPFSAVISTLFLAVSLLSFITAADSNTDVVGGLCAKQTDAEGSSQNLGIKAFWACAIGFMAWVSASFLGDQGIKMLSNLAGVPGLLIVLGSAVSLLLIMGPVLQAAAKQDQHHAQ